MSTITISQYTANPPQQVDASSLLEVRGWYTRPFIASDGVTPVYGNSTNGEQGPYYSITPTLNASNEVVVPAHVVQPTTESNPTANYFEGLWIDGAFVMLLMPNTQSATGWQIPTVYGDPVAYDEIATYNRARRLLYAPNTYFTADQTIQEIERLAGNFDYMAVSVNGIGQASFAPVVASEPIVLMENDPRVGSWTNILSYFADPSNTAAANTVAVGNAVTAAGSGGLYIPVSTFPINSVAIDTPIIFAPGPSILQPANGESITLSDTITADLSQHFDNALGVSGQGSIVLSSNLTVDSVPPQWWGATFDGTTDDAAPIQAAVTAIAGRGGWVDFSDAAGVHATINVPNLVGLRSGNTRRGGMTALSGHAGPFMLSIENGVSSAFDNYIQNFNLNCSDIAGLGGITTKSWQENSGIRNGIIQGFRTYGLYYEGGGGGASTNLCEEAEIFAGASGATAGIKISSGVPDGLIVRVVSSVITGSMARGIDVVKASLECETVHFEECTTGIYLDGVGNHVLINVSGGSGMTNVVEIASTFTGTLQMIGCFRNGATNLLKDNRTGGLGTITTDDPSIIISTVGATVRTDGSVKLTGEMTLVGANTTNLSLYKSVDGTGNGISLSDSLNTTADHENLFITIDPANSLGFGAGALFAAAASGSGTTQDVRIFNGDAKSVIFGTTNLERARFIPSGAFAQIEGAVLTVSGNAIAPTHNIHHVGAGLIKTITLPSGFVSGTLYIIPDAAFTYDATGNIVVPLGGGTAVVGQVMVFTYSSSSGKWYPSY